MKENNTRKTKQTTAIIATVIIALLTSCGETASRQQSTHDTIAKDTTASKVPDTLRRTTEPKTEISMHLLPVTILEESEKDVYKKYGIEFNGNCYSCDLATIDVNRKEVIFTNICDSLARVKFQITGLEENQDNIKVKAEKFTFTFKNTSDGPVIEFSLDGEMEFNEKLRLSKYYIPSKTLEKFEVKDCGEFQG